MQYFFILGNHPALSLAELIAVLGKENLAAFNHEAAVFELSEEFDAKKLMSKLGGTIKMGKLSAQFPIANVFENALEAIEKILPREKVGGGKFKFGFSVYGKLNINEKKMGMEIKRLLKERGMSSRWVVSKEKQLSSVVIDTNDLVKENGMELVILKMGDKILVGKTLAVQPFRELSFRDYGRPSRDDLSGMLPPKLAQIMINLAGINHGQGKDGVSKNDERVSKEKNEIIIMDPFCGSGTILTEAMLMGFKNIIGTDISKKATDDSRTNINWIKEKFKIHDLNCEIINRSATELSKFIAPESVDAIVTEPYLGPQRGKVEIGRVKKELEKLYGEALREFEKVLKKDGRVIMIWPIFRLGNNWQKLDPGLSRFKIINPLENMAPAFREGVSERGTLIYGREGQRVWREIVILERK